MNNKQLELLPLQIDGSKAGSEKARTPHREAVSASSLATMNILYGLSEGVVRGFGKNWTMDDLKKRLYLDGTAVMAADGTVLQEVEVDFRDGSIDQTPIEGMPSQTVETPIDLELRQVAPIARTFIREEVDSYEVRISIAQLVTNTTEGDSLRRRVDFAIDIATDSGSFSEYGKYFINEKITQGFQRTYPVKIPKAGTRTIRVRRITPDNTSDLIADRIVLEAMIEVLEVQFTYPHTALLWVRYDARNYSSVPKLELLMDGKSDLKLPANYDPETRTYATTGVGTTNGVWDGSWKTGYSDNPVWHWFDLATSKRYGIGNRIAINIPDKFYLYALSRYCDELVPDGAGGFEPRFTCNNLYLQKAQDAFTVFKDLSSIFRAKTVWDGAHLNPRMDIPRDAMLIFSRANVSGIKYSTISDSAQHNLIGVQYYDTENQYKTKYAYARDVNDIRQRERIVETNLSALGCTSEGQAQRMATYLLQSELKETNIISFTTGLDGMRPIIGDVFIFADDLLAGKTTSGRVVAVNGTSVTLDRELDPQYDLEGTFVVNTTEQFASTRKIIGISEDKKTVILDSAIDVLDVTGLVWAVRSVSVGLREYVVDDIEYNSDEKSFNISGVQYSREKYPASDNAARIENSPVTIIDPLLPSAPDSVVATYHVIVDQGVNIAIIDVGWSQVAKATWYELEMRRDGGTWQSLGKMVGLTLTIDNAYLGIYEFRVRAVDAMSTASAFKVSAPLQVRGKVIPPPQLAGVLVSGKLFGVNMRWVYPAHTADSRAVRLRVTFQNPALVTTPVVTEYDVPYPATTFTIDGLSPNVDVWVQGAIIDSYGTSGAYSGWGTGRSIADASQVLDILSGQIASEQLDQDLTTKIEAGVEAGAAAANAQTSADQAATAAITANTAASNAQTAASNAQTAASNAQTTANTAKSTADQAKADITALTTSTNTTATELRNRLTTAENGLTQEKLDRASGDTAVVGQLNTYKSSNDAALAAVQQKAEAATTASTANATALTNLTSTVNTKNRTYRQTTAPTANRVIGDLWINTTAGKNNEVRRWNGTAWDDLTDPRTAASATALSTLQTTVATIDGKTTANSNNITQLTADLSTLSNTVDTKSDASAVDSLTARVTTAEGSITSQGTRVTNLENSVNHATTGLATKASSSALTTLDSKVTTIDGKVTTNASNITTLQGKVTTVENGLATKADGSALTALTTRVSNAEGDISSQNTSITNLTASLNVTSATATDAELLARYQGQGKIMWADPTFKAGLNNVIGYTTHANASALQRVAARAANPSGSGFELLRTFTGDPNIANIGILPNALPATANKAFLVKMVAMLPVGYYFLNVSNGVGDGGTHNFVGNVQGTGMFETYWRVIKCGAAGSFGITGHVAVKRAASTPAPTAAAPVEFVLSQFAVYDVTQATDLTPKEVTDAINIKADASALSTTNAEVSRINGVVASQGTSITNLQAGLTTANNNIATKADGTALTSLTTRVTSAEGNITSQGSRVTSLENSVNHATTGLASKASSTALSTLDNKVTGIDGRVTANATQLTQLNSSLTTTNGNVTTAQNAANAAATLAGSKGKVLVQTAAPAVADRLAQNLWIDITGNANTPKRWNGSAWVAVTDKVATDAATAAANALSVAQTKADASALTSLTTRVDTVDGKVTAQATQVTSLSTTVGNNTAAIQLQQSSIDGLSAKATLKVEAGGVVGGVALGNDQGVVDLLVRANRFAIAAPEGTAGGARYAFVYQASPVTLPNGTVIPAGLYLDDAVIGQLNASKLNVAELSAISAKLGTLVTYKDASKPNGARMVMTGSLIEVYDDNNVRRVRFGIW